jgi:hypothetical protein
VISDFQIPSSLKDKAIWIRLNGAGPKTDALSSEVNATFNRLNALLSLKLPNP